MTRVGRGPGGEGYLESGGDDDAQQGAVDENCPGDGANDAGDVDAGELALSGGAERSVAGAPAGGWKSHPLGPGLEARAHLGEPNAVAERIADYSPFKMPAETWERIAPVVRSIVTDAAPHTAYQARDLLTVVSHYVAFCDSKGLPLEQDVLLDRKLIERYLHVGLLGVTDGTRRDYRSQLYRIVEALTLGLPRRGTPFAKSDPSKPYNAKEIAALESMMRGQATEEKRHSGLVLLAGCTGAGLTRADYNDLHGTDVTREGVDVVLHVTGRRPRDVVALAEWADLLLELAGESGAKYLFRANFRRSPKGVTNNFIENLDGLYSAPWPETRRMRATWICWHLAHGTPNDVLIKAAGVDTLHSLSLCMRYVPETPVEEARAWLRGERP